MRTAFIQNLIQLARSNRDIFLVVGDLGFSVVEPFAEEFPDRFLNAGVAEQNATGLAAGLASEGYQVFTYSIANFPTLRCLEQIRNDICYHKLPVTVTSVGGGVAYGNLGFSHHAVQDIAVMRAMPNLTTYSPADPGETVKCLELIVEHKRPAYLRLGKAGETSLHDIGHLADGPIAVRQHASSMAFVATGSILKPTLEAATRLSQRGLEVAVYSCPILSAEDPKKLACLWQHRTLISVEEHGLAGGFGSFLKEHAPREVRIYVCAIPDANVSMVGSQDYLRKQAGLDAESLERIAGRLANE